jgi:hypothetical protein
MKKWIGLALASMGISGCNVDLSDFQGHHSGFEGPHIEGSGRVDTVNRKVGSFRSVSLDGAIDADITIGRQSDIQIKGDDNLIKLVKTEIKGGTLHIYLDGNYSTHHPIKATFSAPALEGASVAGSGDLAIHGFRGSSLSLSIAGSGDVKADGSTDRLSATIAGSGDYRLYNLRATDAKVQISGSGDAEITATGHLSASVTGSGDVHYKGHPTVSKSVVGSGDVSSSE